MAICPNCNKEIKYLRNFLSGENCYNFDGENYKLSEFIENGAVNNFECPECNEILFTDETEAKEFLRGVKESRVIENE